MLCEDTHSLEVRDADGRDRLVRTDDRQRTAAAMTEGNGSLRPTAPPPSPNAKGT